MKQFFKMVFASCLGVVLASIVTGVIFVMVITASVAGAIAAFSDGSEEKTSLLTDKSVLLLDPVGEISDVNKESYEDIFAFQDGPKKSFSLQEILRAIEVARENPKVEAIVLKLEKASMGFATANEIREALEHFKSAGKPIYAYADSYDLGSYYVSSIADKVYAGPEGMMALTGLSRSTIFRKGLLEKLGVEMQIFKVGTFKGAVEPYILDRLSPENRLQIQEMLDGLWQGTTSEIANSRGIERDVLQSFADNGGFMDKMDTALDLHLVDSLVYRIDLDEALAERLSGDKETEIEYRRVGDLLAAETKSMTSDKIAIIYADGDITIGSGEKDSFWGSQGHHITEQTVKEIREATEDEDIKAIVLRVNSPGGVITTSELICHEVERAKATKPVVVSMGNMAASGGYYISSHADMIVANPYTLTGSIGIFGMIPNASGTMKKLGLTEDVVSTSELGVLSITTPLSPKQKAIIQRKIEEGYDTFLTRVSTGRDMTKEAVDSVGQGRVWLGSVALQSGLVDKLGGLQTAVVEAARLAEVTEYRVVNRISKKNWWQKMMDFNVKETISYLSMSKEERMALEMQKMLQYATGIKAMPPFDLRSIEISPRETTPLAF